MKIITFIFLLLIHFLGIAQLPQYHVLKQNIEKTYNINIYDKYNIDFFPNHWLKEPYNLQAFDIQEQDKEFILYTVNEVLKKYPIDLVSSTIHSLYLLDSVVFSGGYSLPMVYSNNQSLYIIASNDLKKDSLKEKFRNGFENVFFDYFPYFKSATEKITEDIKLNFKDYDVSENVVDDFAKTSIKYGVKIHVNTHNGNLPVFLRQKPYFDVVFEKNNNSIIEVLPIIKEAIAKYPEVYRKLVNNIYLFPQIYSNNKLIPSFSYFSDIYLSVLNTDSVIDNHMISSELQKQMSKIICQNLLADISIEKWQNFNSTKNNYNEEIQDIRKTFASFFKSKNNSSSRELLDTTTALKYNYLSSLLFKFYDRIEKIDIVSVDNYAKELERKYDVNILYNFVFPLQNKERIMPSGLSIFSNPNIYQLHRILINIDTALSIYSKAMINKYLENIYLVETMLFNKNNIGPSGTYSYTDKSIYLSNIGASDSSLQKTFHHEFSSLVRKLSGVPFPKTTWLSINDSTFSYYFTDKNAIRIGEENLYQQGFLEEYSTTLFDNDVEVFTSWLFYNPQKLAFIARKYKKIFRKLKVLCSYYKTIDANMTFHDEIENIIK